MAEGKRGSRQGRREPQRPPESSERPQQAQQSFPLFPITFLECVLSDLNVTRYPENAASSIPSGGSLKVDVAQPAFVSDQMHVGVKARAAIPNEETPMWSIEASLNGIFAISEGTDPQLVQDFAQSTVLTLVWPYMRELFQSISIRMRVPPIILPTLDARNISLTGQTGAEPGDQAAKAGVQPE